MVEIIILDKAGNPFAQKKQNLTEANVKAFGVTINISAPWDVNYDGIVDISDLVIVGSHFGESITRQVTPNPDINGDGTVDISDLVLVGSHFKVSE